MNQSIVYQPWWVLTALLCIFSPTVRAQLQIHFPVSRIVFQRDVGNQSTFSVIGSCPTAADRIDVRLIPVQPGQGAATDWQPLAQPQQGQFSGSVTAAGGWYRLDVRAMQQNNQLASGSLDRVGVGEVFIIAGQSNGQGKHGRGSVAPADDRVIATPHYNLSDTVRLPLLPRFASIEVEGVIGPRGQSAWCWGKLGDQLTARLNVPVLFFNTAWDGTAVRNWRESFQIDSTATSYYEYFRPGMPFGNLKRVLNDYVQLTGVRAVLWHQGEAEFYDVDPTASSYANDLTTVINRSRQEARHPLTWVVARVSMDNNLYYNYNLTHYAPVINAQNYVIQTVQNVFPGPDTDVIQMPPRPDGVHFGYDYEHNSDGLGLLATAWSQSLTPDFFSTAPPRLPTPMQVADLSLNLQVSSRIASVGQIVSFTATVTNESNTPATNVSICNRLPPNLTFASGPPGFINQRGLLMASIPSVPARQAVSVVYQARVTAPGYYRNSAEIIRAGQLDTDSTPNTSTADGQDDAASADFRTVQGGGIFVSPVDIVNTDPLPPVISNQPLPAAGLADLSLQMEANVQTIATGQPWRLTMTVRNLGGSPAQNVRVGCILPASLSFQSGSGLSVSGVVVSGTLKSVPVSGSASLVFTAVPTQSGTLFIKAQIEAATPADPDSTPNNGVDNGEDDTAQTTLRVR